MLSRIFPFLKYIRIFMHCILYSVLIIASYYALFVSNLPWPNYNIKHTFKLICFTNYKGCNTGHISICYTGNSLFCSGEKCILLPNLNNFMLIELCLYAYVCRCSLCWYLHISSRYFFIQTVIILKVSWSGLVSMELCSFSCFRTFIEQATSKVRSHRTKILECAW